MTAPHDPGIPIEGLAQSIIAAFQSIADNIQTITGMTPHELQAKMDELPDDQKAALIQRITGSIPPAYRPPVPPAE